MLVLSLTDISEICLPARAGNCSGATGHCANGGTCSADAARVCDCKSGFAGTYCELGAISEQKHTHTEQRMHLHLHLS